MTRRTFALSLAASAAFALEPPAESAKQRGQRLANQVIQGLGGDAFRNMRTRTEIGRASTFYRDDLTGYSVARIYTKYLERDNRTGLLELQRQVLGKKQEDTVLFTSSEGFEVTYRGAKPLTDEQVKQHRDATLNDIFYILRSRISEPGIEFEAAGADVVENQPVQTLDIYDSENRHVRVWVNADTFVPVRQRYERWDPIVKDRREEVTHYTKYRNVAGIMWPYAIGRERDSEKSAEMASERVTFNDALQESLFELPNGIKILTK